MVCFSNPKQFYIVGVLSGEGWQEGDANDKIDQVSSNQVMKIPFISAKQLELQL